MVSRPLFGLGLGLTVTGLGLGLGLGLDLMKFWSRSHMFWFRGVQSIICSSSVMTSVFSSVNNSVGVLEAMSLASRRLEDIYCTVCDVTPW